jgi:hypothetical protein
MAKAQGRRPEIMAQLAACFEILIKRNLPKRNDHADFLQLAKLLYQIGPAAIKLGRRGFIIRRRTTNRCGNVAIVERKPVIFMNRLGLIGESIAVEGFIEPISASISGKNTARPIPTMRRWGQSNNEQAAGRVAKGGNRPAPIDPIAVLLPFHAGDTFSVGHQTGTLPTLSDRLIQQGQ